MKNPLPHTARLRDAIRVIEDARKTIAVVVDSENTVIGALTDGDVRRALLAGLDLSSSVTEAMNPSPLTATEEASAEYLRDLLINHDVEALPLVDRRGRFVRVVDLVDLGAEGNSAPFADEASALIMAGGEGRRLLPLTAERPKPMMVVGGMPLIERQVRRIAHAGIRSIYVSVNYLSDIIEEHLGDGSEFGVRIEYLRENERLGTAGAMSLLPPAATTPLLVVNGDILTTSDYASLLRFHRTENAAVTVGAIEYRVDIPYGVLRTQHTRVVSIEEKPSQRHLCNAGIYVVDRQALDLVPRNAFFNMTDLLPLLIADRQVVAVFPIHEHWIDIGTPTDLQRAREAFANKEFADV